ncbi:hypothetical protein [Cellulomonas sp.]|uniref:hypothetical protein n=1 Tax=Cellulomonas sp. TaxID=40001 RepID=UPI00281225EC|nr:hypothetical protein [Cellulomonas sp.]
MSVLDAGVARDVADYAARVRAALADLEPDQVDDLTDGLEANLADALADDGRAHHGGLVEEFGTPEAYAAELRAAGGIAPARPRHPLRDALAGRWREALAIDDAVLAALRAKRGWRPVEDLLVSVRPAWWVLRGWAVAQVLLRVTDLEPATPWWLPRSLPGRLLLGAAVVASVQWGRGRWVARGAWHGVVSLLSAGAALAAVVLLVWLPAQQRERDGWMQDLGAASPADGVVVDGEYATNLFVYDADGRPLEGAQVVDQDGRPVVTEPFAGDLASQGTVWLDEVPADAYRVGSPGVDGKPRWNAYPLWTVPIGAVQDDLGHGTLRVRPGSEDELLPAAWPFEQVPAVQPWGAEASGPGDATPTPTAAPDATPGATSTPPAAGAPDGTEPNRTPPDTTQPGDDAPGGAAG